MSKMITLIKKMMMNIRSWRDEFLFDWRYYFRLRRLMSQDTDVATGYVLGKQGLTLDEVMNEVDRHLLFALNRIQLMHGHAMFCADLESGYYGIWKPKKFEIDGRLP